MDYTLLLAVISLLLIVVAICISYNTESTSNSTAEFLLESNEVIEIDGYKLRTDAMIPFASKTSYELPHRNNPLGMYNISALRNEHGYFGVIRACSWDGCKSVYANPVFSYPYYIKMDSEGVITDLKLVDLDYNRFRVCTKGYGGVEDPKIFIFQDEEWVIANSLGYDKQSYPCINTMCIFKLSNPKETFTLLSTPSGVDRSQRQKNWSPFEWNGRLLCEYSIEPHIIIEINPTTGVTTEIARSGRHHTSITANQSLRGGAPPILVTINSTPLYLGVGHTRDPAWPTYRHFFYTFDPFPPFNIVSVSDCFKFDRKERIQFAAGLSVYENNVYVSYGVDDCDNRISVYSLDRVIELLQKHDGVSTESTAMVEIKIEDTHKGLPIITYE